MNNSSIAGFENSTDDFSSPNRFSEISYYVHIVKRTVAFIGLFLNLLVMTVIVRNYKKLNNPMYLFIFNVAIPDVAELVVNSFNVFAIPGMLKFPTILYLMFHVQMTWYLTLFSVLGLSINRTVAVLFWRKYDTVSLIQRYTSYILKIVII